jgi:hypothetical protein
MAAVAAAPVSRAFEATALGAPSPPPAPSCVLLESRAGFGKALAGRDHPRLVVVPAAAGWDASLLKRARGGQWVLFESGAGFAAAGAFGEQREGLARSFDLTLEEPRAPWRDGPRPPYVSLQWPETALLRDFSSVVPVHGGETIGRFGALPVAALRRAGEGALLFLGSPLGPALWSDDARAHSWLQAFLAEATRTPAGRRTLGNRRPAGLVPPIANG